MKESKKLKDEDFTGTSKDDTIDIVFGCLAVLIALVLFILLA